MNASTTLFIFIISFIFNSTDVFAMTQNKCLVDDTKCIMQHIETNADTITENRWRNYAYRDLAVAYAYKGNIDHAITLLGKIDNPDTQSITVRAIGMALAIHKTLSPDEYKIIFKKLDDFSKTITHEGARDIAYTYIAMAQAFAGLDDDAMTTTLSMSKPELKNKALGETAEIQAERGDYIEALKSLDAISSIAFKNKSLGLISNIFVKQNNYTQAYDFGFMITNPTKKAAALQKIINAQIGLNDAKGKNK